MNKRVKDEIMKAVRKALGDLENGKKIAQMIDNFSLLPRMTSKLSSLQAFVIGQSTSRTLPPGLEPRKRRHPEPIQRDATDGGVQVQPGSQGL